MNPIPETLSAATLGEPLTSLNLAVFPLLRPATDPPTYLILDEALRTGRFRITEVSQGGSVPELLVINELDQAVLIVDGEQLVGAKQNRIVNLSLLIPGGQSLKIPVSCVEQGRWSTSSAAFAPSPNVMYAEARAHKTRAVSAHLARDANPRADQGEVWNAVHAKLGRMGSASPTRAMDDAYAHHARRLEDYTRGLAAAPGQVGGVFAINGRVLGLDLFDCEATLRKLFPKLVRSYALDALDHWDEKAPSARPDDAAALVADLARADVREYPSVGLGQTFRLEGQGVFGGALVVGDVPVHLCAFRMNGDDSLRAAGSDMLSFRTRRSRLGPYCID